MHFDPSASTGNSDRVLLPDGTAFQFWDDRTSYRAVYHVATMHPQASDANPGTANEPWKTIGRAAELLQPGQKVVVHAGVYREQVVPRCGGTGPDGMIAYEAAPGEEVIVSGAEVWTPQCLPSVGWGKPGSVAIWMADLPVEMFRGYNPFLARNIYEEVVAYSNPAEMSRYMLRRGAVFVNGLPLRQVDRFDQLKNQDGTFWVEEPGVRLHFRLHADVDPAQAAFEITVRPQVFAPREYGLGYIRISGLALERAADGLPVPQRALVSTHRGHHWIIENNRIRWANALGLDVGNQDWKAGCPEHSFGRHIIRNNIISDCGVGGIAGCKYVDETLVEGNWIERIGGLNVEGIAETAGLKFHGAKHALIRHNVFRDHIGASGVWLDYSIENCRVTGNLFYGIKTAAGAVWLEASRKANLIDRNVFVAIRKSDWQKSGRPYEGSGVHADGANTIVAHNLFFDIDGFAVFMSGNIWDPGRLVEGSPIAPVGHRILNNMFAACLLPIHLAGNSGDINDESRALVGASAEHRLILGNSGNLSDGNLFDAGTAHALFGLQNPVLDPKPGLAEWRNDFGQDANSSQVPLEVTFDPAEMTLRFASRDLLPTSPAVPELGGEEGAFVCPGPFDLATFKRFGEGQMVTWSWPVPARTR